MPDWYRCANSGGCYVCEVNASLKSFRVVGTTDMRKVILEVSVSLDGFIEGPGGDLDWLRLDPEPCDVERFLSDFDTLFFGRKAYERVAFPIVPEGELWHPDMNLFRLGGIRKYVFSRTRRHVEGNAMVIREDLASEVLRIRAEDGKDIRLCGGADILNVFSDLDLIDRYHLRVHPVLLKEGKPLFQESGYRPELKLIGEWSMDSGTTLLQYERGMRIKI